MKLNKLISGIITITFLLNTISTDLALAQNVSADKLATPSEQSGIMGIEPKDIGDIELWFAAFLNEVQHNLGAITVENLQKYYDLNTQRLGNTRFQLPGAHFFFPDIKEAENGVIRISAVRKDDRNGPRQYTIDYNPAARRLDVYPEGKSPQRTAEGRRAIDKYIEQEKGIDSLTAWAYTEEAKKAGVRIYTPEELGIYYSEIVDEVVSTAGLVIENPQGLLPIEKRRCAIIMIPPGVEDRLNGCSVKTLALDGTEKTVVPYFHSSNNSVHIFVTAEEAKDLAEYKHRLMINIGRAIEASERVRLKVKLGIAHEVGVMLGQKILYFGRADRPVNRVDERFDQGKWQSQTRSFIIPEKYTISDLDHVKGRDYAGGAKATRKELLRSATRPGKSPEDAMIIIALYLFGKWNFTAKDYYDAYKIYCRGHGFEAPAGKMESALETIRRDLERLREKTFLGIKARAGKESIYTLTESGRAFALGLRGVVKATGKMVEDYLAAGSFEEIAGLIIKNYPPDSMEKKIKLFSTAIAIKSKTAEGRRFLVSDVYRALSLEIKTSLLKRYDLMPPYSAAMSQEAGNPESPKTLDEIIGLILGALKGARSEQRFPLVYVILSEKSPRLAALLLTLIDLRREQNTAEILNAINELDMLVNEKAILYLAFFEPESAEAPAGMARAPEEPDRSMAIAISNAALLFKTNNGQWMRQLAIIANNASSLTTRAIARAALYMMTGHGVDREELVTMHRQNEDKVAKSIATAALACTLRDRSYIDELIKIANDKQNETASVIASVAFILHLRTHNEAEYIERLRYLQEFVRTESPERIAFAIAALGLLYEADRNPEAQSERAEYLEIIKAIPAATPSFTARALVYSAILFTEGTDLTGELMRITEMNRAPAQNQSRAGRGLVLVGREKFETLGLYVDTRNAQGGEQKLTLAQVWKESPKVIKQGEDNYVIISGPSIAERLVKRGGRWTVGVEGGGIPVTNVVSEILKMIPHKFLDGFLGFGAMAEVLKEAKAQCKKDIYLADGKAAFIFSNIATFGERRTDGSYEEGLGPVLSNLVKSDIRIAVIATTDKQVRLIEELNKNNPPDKQIICESSIDGAKTALTGTARYYYFKVASEPEPEGVTSVTIIAREIIRAIGRIAKIVKPELVEMIHQAAVKFAQAA